MRKFVGILWGGVAGMGLIVSAPAFAQKKSVAEEILDILRARNQISEQQYRDLLVKARAEDESLQEKLAAPPAAIDPSTFRLYWKDGVRFDSSDGDFKLRIGGRIMSDWTIFDTDEDIRNDVNDGDPIGSGTRFRRARLYMEGDVYKNTKFKAQYDFAGSDADFKDVYLRVKKIPYFGNLTIGHFKEPFSLEELTSSKYITFMERSLPNVFSPSRNSGFMLNNAFLNDRATWAVGGFREVDDTGDGFGKDSPYNITTRLTGLPWYEEQGRQLLHVGISYSHKFRDDPGAAIRFRARPEAALGPRFVDTGDFEVENIDLINPEAALVYGPFSLQGEYTHASMDADEASDPGFHAFYVFGSYFLTGEHRAYKTSSGAFDRVKPRCSFDWNGCWGALEAGFRYSYLDLNDAEVRGGKLQDFTFGLNWYLNPNVRFMFNYVFADLEDSGESNVFESRFQVDF